MATGPEACLGILEHRAAPQGPLPRPKPQFICSWPQVHGGGLNATQTHRQPAEGRADSALPGREPRPLNPEGQPSAHWKARTKAGVRVGQDLGTGRLGGLGDLASKGLGSSWRWEACRAWGGVAAVHFQLLESVRSLLSCLWPMNQKDGDSPRTSSLRLLAAAVLLLLPKKEARTLDFYMKSPDFKCRLVAILSKCVLQDG